MIKRRNHWGFSCADLFAAMLSEYHERVKGPVRKAMATNDVVKNQKMLRKGLSPKLV